MSSPYVENANRKVTATPQSEAISPNQAKNNAGGFSFVVDDWKRLERFLILGSAGGTYYVDEKKLTRQNAACVERCLMADPTRALSIINGIGSDNRAPKQDPALFALALALKDSQLHTRLAARELVRNIARTGTHLLHLVAMLDGLGGWGRGTKKAIGRWYTEQDPNALAYQLVKYQQRDGWSHADVLRLVHTNRALALYRWATGGMKGLKAREVKKFAKGKPETAKTFKYDAIDAERLPAIIRAFEQAKVSSSKDEVKKLIVEEGLPREGVPTGMLNDPGIWEALLVHMPVTAMIRNLGKMTNVGLVVPLSDAARAICERLQSATRLEHGRVHPIQVLMALSIYNKGSGHLGKLDWKPVQTVCKALDDAFYLTFKTVPPTNKRHLVGLDVSGSMGGGNLGGTFLTPREGTAALAMLIARREPEFHIMGFSNTFMPLKINASMGLDQVIKNISGLPFKGTDCALPMQYALKNKLPVDCFQVMTDSETWAGSQHPSEALREYRHKMGIPAKLVVHGMVANEFTIADPDDAGMMDVVGFDSAVPVVVDDFLRG